MRYLLLWSVLRHAHASLMTGSFIAINYNSTTNQRSRGGGYYARERWWCDQCRHHHDKRIMPFHCSSTTRNTSGSASLLVILALSWALKHSCCPRPAWGISFRIIITIGLATKYRQYARTEIWFATRRRFTTNQAARYLYQRASRREILPSESRPPLHGENVKNVPLSVGFVRYSPLHLHDMPIATQKAPCL